MATGPNSNPNSNPNPNNPDPNLNVVHYLRNKETFRVYHLEIRLQTSRGR